MMIIVVFLALCNVLSALAAYKNCPVGDESKLNVHLVAHTHDDVGWLKTVDQYYYGARNSIQRAGVQYILDSVIQELLSDYNKKFIYVETAFFWRWWNEQHDSTRHLVKGLVNNGQLEFIGGGWSMEDEACSHYSAIIENMSWGLRRINDTFGPDARPVVAWQIDPFGHSREQASLFAHMGYDGLFFGRLDYADKLIRELSKNMEFVWKGSSNLGNSSWLFTGVLPNGYAPPDGFDFDILSDDAPIMDDDNLEDYNLDSKIKAFKQLALDQSLKYATNHIIMTMGDDFNYQNAHVWYKNLDKLIKYTSGTDLNVFYSTPSCYLMALHNAKRSWNVKEDDFFPYASDPHAYWTGYYTSRPALKRYIRQTNDVLQVCSQLSGLCSRLHEPVGALVGLRETLGVLQHHDAVTGTSKQHVADDYAKRAYKSMEACQTVIGDSLNYLMKNSSSSVPLLWETCPLLNISECGFTERQTTYLVSVYNPLSLPREHIVKIPVVKSGFKVYDDSGKKIPTEIYPIPSSVLRVPGRKSVANSELVFIAKLPAFGYRVYYVQETDSRPLKARRHPLKKDVTIGKKIKVDVDAESGLMTKISHGSVVIKVNQTFGYYKSMSGKNDNFEDRASGAYVFRPNGTSPILFKKPRRVTTFKGLFYEEIEQEYTDWLSHIIRVYPEKDFVESDWIAGPIPVKDGVGKELIVNIQTDLINGHYFYTDSNGRENLVRKRNFRPTWQLNVTEPVSGNYYPVNSHITLKDYSGKQLSLLPDRPQGGGSRHNGQMELMLHRRCLYDDKFGVDEALNETAFGVGLVVRGQHRLVAANSDVLVRFHAKDIFYQPQIYFAQTKMDVATWSSSYVNKFSGLHLNGNLPPNVNILTLTPWKGSRLLLRLEHFFEKNDDSQLSQPAKIFLKNLFSPWRVRAVEELNLSANQYSSEVSRLRWKVKDNEEPRSFTNNIIAPDFIILLYPMQIRTFLIDVE